MISASGLGLVPLYLDDMDFVFASNNVVATEDNIIAELIEAVSEGAAVDCASDIDCNGNSCTPQPTLMTFVVVIAAVGNFAYVPLQFRALLGLVCNCTS